MTRGGALLLVGIAVQVALEFVFDLSVVFMLLRDALEEVGELLVDFEALFCDEEGLLYFVGVHPGRGGKRVTFGGSGHRARLP